MYALPLLAVCLAAAPVPTPTTPRAFVVLIGINEYADKEIPKRAHLELDAQAIHDNLVDRRFLGNERDRVWLLLGKNATRERILEILDTIRKDANPEDFVLFGFFGQGAGLGERGDRVCYLTADSTVRGRDRNALSDADLIETFSRLRSRRVCVLLDVCFQGFRTSEIVPLPVLEEREPRETQRAYPEFLGPFDRGRRDISPGRILLTARRLTGSPLQEKHGLVAECVLSGLKETKGKRPATTADLESASLKYITKDTPSELVIHKAVDPPFAFAARTSLIKPPFKPLPMEEAHHFQKKVMDGIQVIREEHALQPSEDQLLRLGIQGLYNRLEEPMPEEIVQRLGKLASLDREERAKLLVEVRLRLGQRDYLDRHRVVGWFLQETVTRLDHASDFSMRERIWICGPIPRSEIGADFRRNTTTGFIEIIDSHPGSPAAKAGLRNGDVITSITRETGSFGNPLEFPETHSTEEITTREFVHKVWGKEDTSFRLMVRSPGEEKARVVELVRKPFEVDTVRGVRRKQDGTWDFWVDADKKIGYIRISRFTYRTPKEVETVLTRLRKEGLKSLVLDLRFNPGGLFDGVKRVAGLFLKEGILATLNAPRLGSSAEVMKIEPGKERFDGPLILMLNEASASGSEMLAGALRDHRRCLIAGARTGGHCGIQNMMGFMGYELLLSTVVFKTPNGRMMQGWQPEKGGISPDNGLSVPLSRRDRDELHERLRNSEFLLRRGQPLVDPYAGFRDAQLQKALQALRESAR